ncbi:MAG: 30S ribosomal protein S16 [Phycisphaerales bacterium JB038]
MPKPGGSGVVGVRSWAVLACKPATACYAVGLASQERGGHLCVTSESDTVWRPGVVRLRLKRMGRRHKPFYRLNAIEKRAPRDGRIIESLGWFDPLVTDESKAISLNADRIRYWLSVGAQPTETVRTLLKRADIDPTPGQKYTPAEA